MIEGRWSVAGRRSGLKTPADWIAFAGPIFIVHAPLLENLGFNEAHTRSNAQPTTHSIANFLKGFILYACRKTRLFLDQKVCELPLPLFFAFA